MAYANSPALQFLKNVQERMKEQQAVLQEALRLQNQSINDFTRTVEGFVNPTCYEDDLMFMEKLLQALKNTLPARDALEAAKDHITSCLERSYLSPAVPEPAPAPSTDVTTTKRPRVVKFDEKKVEGIVVSILTQEAQLRKSQLMQILDDCKVAYSKAGLERILHTCPSIEIVGDRDRTRYQLKEVAVGA